MVKALIRSAALAVSKTKNLAPYIFKNAVDENGNPIQVQVRAPVPNDMKIAREQATENPGDPARGIPAKIGQEKMALILGARLICDEAGEAVFEASDTVALMDSALGGELLALGMRKMQEASAAGN